MTEHWSDKPLNEIFEFECLRPGSVESLNRMTHDFVEFSKKYPGHVLLPIAEIKRLYQEYPDNWDASFGECMVALLRKYGLDLQVIND